MGVRIRSLAYASQGGLGCLVTGGPRARRIAVCGLRTPRPGTASPHPEVTGRVVTAPNGAWRNVISLDGQSPVSLAGSAHPLGWVAGPSTSRAGLRLRRQSGFEKIGYLAMFALDWALWFDLLFLERLL